MVSSRNISSRWLDILAAFNFTVDYRRDPLNIDVDYLSRDSANNVHNGVGDDKALGEDHNQILLHQIDSNYMIQAVLATSAPDSVQIPSSVSSATPSSTTLTTSQTMKESSEEEDEATNLVHH